jgi:hypothetical protein
MIKLVTRYEKGIHARITESRSRLVRGLTSLDKICSRENTTGMIGFGY